MFYSGKHTKKHGTSIGEKNAYRSLVGTLKYLGIDGRTILKRGLKK
jgi:hypothetical protein